MAKESKAPADEEDDEEKSAAVAKSKPDLKKIILIVIGVLVLTGLSVGGTLLATGAFNKQASAQSTKAKAKKKSASENSDADTAPDATDENDAAADQGDAATDGAADAAAEDETDADSKQTKQAIYFDFDQPFVVNFMDENQLRYLQVTVAVMSHSETMPEIVKRHMPLIRNNLVMLLSGRTRDMVLSREGKEKIRAEAQAEVQRILKEQTGSPVIESLFLTSFVMQ